MIDHIASSSEGNAHVIAGKVLLDASVKMGKIRRVINPTKLAGALIGHEHGDHSASVGKLLRASVDIWTSRGTAQALGVSNHYRVHEVSAGDRFEIADGFRGIAVRAVHDAAEPLGFVVVGPYDGRTVKVLYLTDTAYSPAKFNGLTHILVECNYSHWLAERSVQEGRIPSWQKERLIRTHFGLRDVIEFLEACDLSRTETIHLLHLSGSNADPEKFREAIEGATGVPVEIAGKYGGME